MAEKTIMDLPTEFWQKPAHVKISQDGKLIYECYIAGQANICIDKYVIEVTTSHHEELPKAMKTLREEK